MCCEEQSSQKRSLATPFRMKSVNARDPKQNITGDLDVANPIVFVAVKTLYVHYNNQDQQRAVWSEARTLTCTATK